MYIITCRTRFDTRDNVCLDLQYCCYSIYIVVVSFIGGGNQNTRRTSRSDYITKRFIVYIFPWSGIELTTLAVIGTDRTSKCKSNYHTIAAMTVLFGIGPTYILCYKSNTSMFCHDMLMQVYIYLTDILTLEKTEWAIKNGQSRDTGNIGYTRHRTKTNKTKQNKKHNTGNKRDE